jgi:hypothetical protein
VLLLYGFFICPGLVDSNVALHRQAFLIVFYVLAILVFSILASLKLAGETVAVWGVIFTPLWTVIFVNLLSLAWEKVIDVKVEFVSVATGTIGLILL